MVAGSRGRLGDDSRVGVWHQALARVAGWQRRLGVELGLISEGERWFFIEDLLLDPGFGEEVPLGVDFASGSREHVIAVHVLEQIVGHGRRYLSLAVPVYRDGPVLVALADKGSEDLDLFVSVHSLPVSIKNWWPELIKMSSRKLLKTLEQLTSVAQGFKSYNVRSFILRKVAEVRESHPGQGCL
jgi:hypothetical protein